MHTHGRKERETDRQYRPYRKRAMRQEGQEKQNPGNDCLFLLMKERKRDRHTRSPTIQFELCRQAKRTWHLQNQIREGEGEKEGTRRRERERRKRERELVWPLVVRPHNKNGALLPL